MTTNDPWTNQPTQWHAAPPRRPGQLTAAAVLGFVEAGMAILGGLVVILSFVSVDAEDRAGFAPLLFVGAVLQLAVNGTLIAAAVRLLRGTGWTQFQVCMGINLALSVLYFALLTERVDELDGVGVAASSARETMTGSLLWPFVFAALSVVAMSLANGRPAKLFCFHRG